MKSLYASIEINKKVSDTEDDIIEKIEYYKTKAELYGIEVVKKNNMPNKEVSDINQITEDEGEINSILDKLVSNVVMYNFEDIINDLIKNMVCTC